MPNLVSKPSKCQLTQNHGRFQYKRDVSDIDGKVMAMYARSMSTRDISATIDDVCCFKLNAEQIKKITGYVLEEQRNWQNRSLKPFYPFIFVDCLYLGLWIQDTENKLQIFDEIKSRGVQEVGFMCIVHLIRN